MSKKKKHVVVDSALHKKLKKIALDTDSTIEKTTDKFLKKATDKFLKKS